MFVFESLIPEDAPIVRRSSQRRSLVLCGWSLDWMKIDPWQWVLDWSASSSSLEKWSLPDVVLTSTHATTEKNVKGKDSSSKFDVSSRSNSVLFHSLMYFLSGLSTIAISITSSRSSACSKRKTNSFFSSFFFWRLVSIHSHSDYFIGINKTILTFAIEIPREDFESMISLVELEKCSRIPVDQIKSFLYSDETREKVR